MKTVRTTAQKQTAFAARRAELGQRQRDKTRAALVAAAVRVFQVKMPDAAVIDDFTTEAGVSRGTFYNHFPDVATIQMAVALKFSDEMNEEIRAAYKSTTDPAERVSIAVRHFVKKASADPHWGSVVVRVANQGPLGKMMREAARPDVIAGLALKRFLLTQEEVAADLIVGTAIMAMQSGVEGRMRPLYPEATSEAILRGLGLSHPDAREVSARPLPSLESPKGTALKSAAKRRRR